MLPARPQGAALLAIRSPDRLLVEGDHPALSDALVAAASAIGIADLTERSRVFFHSLGIRPLTALAGAGTPVFGTPAPPPFWFKPHHRDLLVTMLRRPLFSRAPHELAVRQRHATSGFSHITLAEIQHRVESITGIAFFDAISREYHVGGQAARVPVETAVQAGVIGLVGPRTELDFQQLVAQSLAEVAGRERRAGAGALDHVPSARALPHHRGHARLPGENGRGDAGVVGR